MTNTGRYLQRGNFSRQVWEPAVARAGLKGLRFHDLRHTAATLAAATGATTRELSSGWATQPQRWRGATSTSWQTGRPH
jgi:integrase